MHLLETRVLCGPNYWSIRHQQLIVAKIHLAAFEYLPTNKLPRFFDLLRTSMPSLVEHHCSEEHRGGFFERVEEGTWLGHVVEHIALELQWLAGMKCSFGRTRSAEAEGVYHVVFAYEIEEAGLYALHAAIEIVKQLANGRSYEIGPDVQALGFIKKEKGFGPSTLAIIDEARSRGIPVRYLRESEVVVLGQGRFQKMFCGTIAGSTSFLGVDLTDSKARTKSILKRARIPLPEGRTVNQPGDLFLAINETGFPAVVKPVNGNHGRGVVTNIRTYSDLQNAFEAARKISSDVLVEQFIEGDDFRFLVVGFKLVAAAKRTPPSVRGDGQSTVRELIDKLNTDPRRGNGHENVLTRVRVDEPTLSLIQQSGFTMDAILPAGVNLILKTTANLSTGGTSTDVTDLVHPYNILLAERIARLLNLDVCGIDLISKDIALPLTGDFGAVIEVNASPGLRMHLAPSLGQPRPVGKAIVDLLYPPNSQSSIPVVAITGTNGKTTTTRLIAHLARNQGYRVGCTTTDGIYIQDYLVEKGDCTGPGSTQVVLGDPTIDFAVLECARGGILRGGLGFSHCDISVITNVSDDHLGIDGIATLDDMARLKSVVAQSTCRSGYAILNADDDRVYAMRKDVECKVALFSRKGNSKRILNHCKKGGLAAVIEAGMVVVRHGTTRIWIDRVDRIPLSFGGKAKCMIENILPAVLVGVIQNFDLPAIRESLLSFIPSFEFTPGRMNIYHFSDFQVMIDYGHNVAGLKEISYFLERVQATVKVGIITAVGDRRDEDIEQMGFLSATMFDEVIIRLDKDLRGRSSESMVRLLQQGMRRAKPFLTGLVIPDEIDALRFAITSAIKGSFITIFTEEMQKTSEFLRTVHEKMAGDKVQADDQVLSHG